MNDALVTTAKAAGLVVVVGGMLLGSTLFVVSVAIRQAADAIDDAAAALEHDVLASAPRCAP